MVRTGGSDETGRGPSIEIDGMRYEDGPTAQVEILIDAPIEEVWQLVTDIDLPARFSNEFAGAAWGR